MRQEKMDKTKMQESMLEIKHEMERVRNKSYQNRNVQTLLRSQPYDRCVTLAIESFVGSLQQPRSKQFAAECLQLASSKAEDDQ